MALQSPTSAEEFPTLIILCCRVFRYELPVIYELDIPQWASDCKTFYYRLDSNLMKLYGPSKSMEDLYVRCWSLGQDTRNPFFQVFNNCVGALVDLQTLRNSMGLDPGFVVSSNLLDPCTFFWCPHRGTKLPPVNLLMLTTRRGLEGIYQDIRLEFLDFAFHLIDCCPCQSRFFLRQDV